MRDRLHKLKEAATDLDSHPYESGCEHVSVDVDKHEAQAQLVMQQCSAVRADIANIRATVALVVEKHAEALGAITTQQARERRAELDDLMVDVSHLASKVRRDLNRIQAQIMAVPAAERGQVLPRMRQQQYSTLSRNFAEVLTEYSDVQARYTQNCRDRVARQYKIVAPQATEVELQAAVERGVNMFQAQILSADHAASRRALEDIEDRQEAIRRVEVSMRELQMLMKSLAQHINDQGDKLDNIAAHTAVATDYTERAEADLGKAKEKQVAARKKKIAAFTLVAILALLLALVLVFKLM